MDTKSENNHHHYRRHRYRLALYNERKGKTIFSFAMPIWLLVFLSFLLTVLACVLIVLIIPKTPLKNYLPGYLDVTKRTAVMEVAVRLDSMEYESRMRMMYLENLIAIMSDQTKNDTVVSYDSVVVYFKDSLLATSEVEKSFVAEYAEKEKFALSVLQSQESASLFFWTPIKGTVRCPEELETQAGIRVEFEGVQSVLSPLEGVVVVSDFILGEGYKIVIQHYGEYLTVMSHLSASFVVVGQRVASGEVIGRGGEISDRTKDWIDVCLWYKNKPLSPQSVMQF